MIRSIFGLIWAAWTAIVFGLFLGAAELVFRKIEVVDNPPAKEILTSPAFVQGSSAGGDYADEKIARFVARKFSNLSLTEGDLNVFLGRSVQAPKDSLKVVLNTRISQKTLQIGMLMYPDYLKYPVCLKFIGGFEKIDGGFSYVANEAYLGALPLPDWLAQPILDASFAKMFGSKEALPLRESWRLLSNVEVGRGAVELSL